MGNSEPSADSAWHENQLLLAPVLGLWANPDCDQPGLKLCSISVNMQTAEACRRSKCAESTNISFDAYFLLCFLYPLFFYCENPSDVTSEHGVKHKVRGLTF